MKVQKIFSVAAIAALSLSFLSSSPAFANTDTTIKTTASVASKKVALLTPKLTTTYPYNGKSSSSIWMSDAAKLKYFNVTYKSGASISLRPQVQIYNTKTKKWETKTYARAASNGSKVSLRFSYNLSSVKNTGVQQLRIYIPSTSKTRAFTSAKSKVNFKKHSYGSMNLEKSGKRTINYGGSVTYTFSLPKTVTTANVQYYNTKTKRWAYERRATFKKSYGNYRQYTWKISHPGTAKTVQYRIQSNATKTHNQYLSKTIKVTFPKGKAYINTSNPIDNKLLSVRTQDKVGVYVTNAPNATVNIQYYSNKNKKWVNSTSAKAKNTKNRQKVLIPYPKYKAGTYKLRVAVQATANFKSVGSRTATVKYVDQNKYTGVRKTAYNQIKKWCPGVTIGTTKFAGNIIGNAKWPTHHINIHPNLRGTNLRATAIHECAHILQLKTFNEDIGAISKRANSVYGKNKRGSGLEIQADCMTEVMGGKSVRKYAYYTSGKACNSKRVAAAKKVVQGKKF